METKEQLKIRIETALKLIDKPKKNTQLYMIKQVLTTAKIAKVTEYPLKFQIFE